MKPTNNELAIAGATTIILGASAPLLIPFGWLAVVGVGLLRRSAWLHQLVGQPQRRLFSPLLLSGDRREATGLLPTPKANNALKPHSEQRPAQSTRAGWFDRTLARLSTNEVDAFNPIETPTQQPKEEIVTLVSNKTGIYGGLQARISVPPQPANAAAEWSTRQPTANVLDEDERAWLGVEQAALHNPLQRRMSVRELCATLNSNVDEYPHLVLFGDSGAGKTILAQLLAATRPGKIVVLDPKRPKGWETAKWSSLPYVSRARDSSYKPMVDALKAVVKEMDDRYARLEEAAEPFEQLTVLLDEARNSVAECDELAELYKKIVSIGREVNVRLILLSTTDRVGPLGFGGEGDALESFVRIRLGKFAGKVLPEVKQLGTEKYLWSAVQFGEWQPFDSSRTLAYVQQLPPRPDRAWKGVEYNCQVTPQETTIGEAGFLAEMLTRNDDKVIAQVASEVKHFVSAENALLATSDALCSVASDRRVLAQNILTMASSEERVALRKCLHLHIRQGRSKTAAIGEAFGTRGGDKFKRAVELVDAWKLLK